MTTHETNGDSSQGEETLSLKKNETMPSETISEDAKGNCQSVQSDSFGQVEQTQTI